MAVTDISSPYNANIAAGASTGSFRLTQAGDVTRELGFSRNVAVQITGAATAVNVVIERSARNPAGGVAAWSAAGDPITGNPSTGIQVVGYIEPGVGWWRARLVSITGASVDIDISGGGAS